MFMILLTHLSLALADGAPQESQKPATVEESKQPKSEEPQTVAAITTPKDLTAKQATNLLNSIADDLSRGEIEAVLRNMTDTVHIITADGLIYKGKKAVRKALNTALAGDLESIVSTAVVNEIRQNGTYTVAIGRSTDTLKSKDKKPLTLNTLFSIGIIDKEGQLFVDSVHHSADIRDNALLRQQKEVFTYVATAVAGVSVILGFVLGLGL